MFCKIVCFIHSFFLNYLKRKRFQEAIKSVATLTCFRAKVESCLSRVCEIKVQAMQLDD